MHECWHARKKYAGSVRDARLHGVNDTRLLTLTYTDSYRFLTLKSYADFRTASKGQYPLGNSV